MRLRQLVIATNNIEVLADNICNLFELKRTYRDPELIVFGLENILIPLGDTFIELVTPVKENTSAERFLKKGSKVYLEGQLETRKWQDNSGADRYST